MQVKQETGVLPNFVIIGAMRSGTSSLARYLRAHPEVLMSPTKEVHFFDRHFDRGSDWYRSQFLEASGKQAIGEATPEYLYRREVPARMASIIPRAKLVAILRNPVDRAYSHYWFMRTRGGERLSFKEAIERDVSQGGRRGYLGRSQYFTQISRFLDHYPKEAIHVVLLEELDSSPAAVYRSICSFLGIDSNFIPKSLGVAVHPYVTFRSLAVMRRVRRLSKTLFGTRVIKWVAPRLRTKSGHVFGGKPDSYPPMDPAIRKELLEFFEKENAELAAWLGRDLTLWAQ